MKGLALVGGLPEALARMSEGFVRDLRTRAGIAHAQAEVRRRFPAPEDTALRVRISTATPPRAFEIIEQVRAVVEHHPEAGILHEDWRSSGPHNGIFPFCEITGVEVVPQHAREAWDLAAAIAATCHIHFKRYQ